MKLLIVDDHPLVRKGIVSVLTFERGIEEISEASNIEEAMNQLQVGAPTLAIVDLYLADEDGLQIISRSRKNGSKTKFIILTSSIKKDDYIRARELNVDGYILKEAFAEDILYAIHVVARGKKFIDPEVIRYQTIKSEKEQYLSELTPREGEVLAELGKGMSNIEIANELYISENTVKKHVSNILCKLELSDRTQAALIASGNVASF